MSLLSNNMRIAITADRIGVSMAGSFTEFPLRSVHGLPDTSQLQQALAKITPQAKAEVVLSQSIAPVWLLPAPLVSLKPSEIEGWAMDTLIQRIGDRATELRLSWDTPPPGDPVLVTGSAESFMQTLQEGLKHAGIRVVRIEPWLAVASRDNSNNLEANGSWLGLTEPGHVTIARFVQGSVQTLRTAMCESDKEDPLELLLQMLQRETLLAGSSHVPIVLLNSIHLNITTSRLRGLRLHAQSHTDPSLKAMLGAGLA